MNNRDQDQEQNDMGDRGARDYRIPDKIEMFDLDVAGGLDDQVIDVDAAMEWTGIIESNADPRMPNEHVLTGVN